MIKHGLLAAGLVLAAAAPAVAQVQFTPTPATAVMIPSGTIIFAPTAPPEARVETPPPPPMPDVAWTPGHWAWNVAEARYDWVNGGYIQRPTAVAAYTPGHWEQRPNGYVWIDGAWH